MGLDTSHNCWHGPYSSFNRFRKSLATQIGIDLDEYIGYGEKGTKDLTTIEHDIQPLLNHSDCDGKLTVKEARQIAKGLNNILENFNDKIQADYNFKENIIQFRDGCLDAVSKKQKIDFH
jgi:hypothetical protein